MIKKKLFKELEEIDKKEVNNSFCEINSVRRIAVKSEIGSIELNEAKYWCQRAKNLWIKHEDENTTFFHKACLLRQRKSIITEIKDERGVTHNSSH